MIRVIIRRNCPRSGKLVAALARARDQKERFPEDRDPGVFLIDLIYRLCFAARRKYYSVLHTRHSVLPLYPRSNTPSSNLLPRRAGCPSILPFFIFGGILAKNCRRNDIIARCRDQFPSTSSSLLHSTAVFYYVLYRIIAHSLLHLLLLASPRVRRTFSSVFW